MGEVVGDRKDATSTGKDACAGRREGCREGESARSIPSGTTFSAFPSPFPSLSSFDGREDDFGASIMVQRKLSREREVAPHPSMPAQQDED
jgi:hypothetical protein